MRQEAVPEDSAVGPDHLVIAQIAALDLGRLTPLEAINLYTSIRMN